MRFFIVWCIASIAGSSSLAAQALDIGGIEVRLGQSVTDALTKLRVAYDVTYNENLKSWFVDKHPDQSGRHAAVGNIGTRDGVVTSIFKYYELADVYQSINVYTQAMRDTQRRGGTICSTRPVEMTDDRFWAIETVCGSYKLSLNLPDRNKKMTGEEDDRIGAGVNVSVIKKP